MKNRFFTCDLSALPIAALATASLFALAPLARAQQTPPPPPPPPSAAPDQNDIFDAIKKGADRLQKEARKTRDIEPELHQLLERQDELERRLAESNKELEVRDKEIIHQIEETKRELNRQQDLLVQVSRALDRLDAEMRAHHGPPPPPPHPAAEPQGPGAGEPLPVTEPVKPAPTAAPAPSPQS
jgi:septal ring factor EnvC (AmiA/AmiB activator)